MIGNLNPRPCRTSRLNQGTSHSVRIAVFPIIALVLSSAAAPHPADPTSSASAREAAPSRMILVRMPVADAGSGPAGSTRAEAAGAADVLPLGSHIVRWDRSRTEGGSAEVANLTLGFAAAGRPDVSFDGQRILFIAKRTPNDPFSVWEMNTNGAGLRQLTDQPGPASTAAYLSTLYTLDASEPVFQAAWCAEPSHVPGGPSPGLASGPAAWGSSLYTIRLGDPMPERFQRITFNPNGVFDPYPLSDGRLLFAAHTPPNAGDPNSAEGSLPPGRCSESLLFTVNPDGTDVFVFAGLDEPPARRGMPCETADGEVVYVESQANAPFDGGALVAVKRARSLHSRRLIADDHEGWYHSPGPLHDGKLLVSYRAQGERSFGVYVLDPGTGERITKLVDSPQWYEVDAHALGPRPMPAGRSSVVDERSDTGLLYCLNAYLSDSEAGRRIAPGQIARLQVFALTEAVENVAAQAAPEPGKDLPTVSEELLGEVPVEGDGSVFLEVPARTPLRLSTLDAQGRVLQRMESWIWVMPKESRGCIGCHEDRELAPPNRHPLALRQPPRVLVQTQEPKP